MVPGRLREFGIFRLVLTAMTVLLCGLTAAAQIGSDAKAPLPHHLEAFQPELAAVNTVDEAMLVLPAFLANKQDPSSKDIADAIDSFLRLRFVHGFSEYGFHENWSAHLSGYVWSHLRNPVLPDDILAHRRAACSQQAIVFQEMLRRSGISYATVSFTGPGHFVTAAYVAGEWRYYDPNIEMSGKSVPVKEVLRGAGLEQAYDNDTGALLAQAASNGRAWLHGLNRYQAPQAALFHRGTKLVSAYGWLFSLGALVASIVSMLFLRTPIGREKEAVSRRFRRSLA